MKRFLKSTPWAAIAILALLNACGDRHQTMAMKSQQAFEEAQRKGIPIAKGGHGGHTNAEGDAAMSGMPGMGAASTDSSNRDMKGMDMAGMKPGEMKGMDMPGMKHGDMKGVDMAGMKHGDMNGMNMPGMKPGEMKGMDMAMKPGEMKGMDMAGMKHDEMKGMDMPGMKHGDMKGMDMPGMKPGEMKGMDMPGMAMTPVVPQPKALQAKPGETAATLLSDPLDRPAASSVSSAQQSAEMVSGGGMTMSMGSYVQRDVGRASSSPEPMKEMDHGMPGMNMGGAAAPMPGMKHESTSTVPNQTRGATGSAPKKSAAMYVCASHPEIVRDRPGKCPVDGTPLVKKEMH